MIKAIPYGETMKHLAQMTIRWRLVIIQGADVIEISPKFLREVLAEIYYADCSLLLQNQLLFLDMICSLETLPREGASKEVEEHIPKGLQVVAAMLHCDRI